MFLKSIELKGFKSFADRTHIDFLPGVTCIVGPNGCGKSNIIDAIRWVLGEQSSTSLRARRMEDVIFSGTKHRPSQNFASVRLIFSGAKQLSPGGLDELSIERILHRSGESTYKVNGLSVRLKDLRQLFMDTAVGITGYSLISQGDIDNILKENKDDRRKIFEEASGISLLHYKKEEAKRRLVRVEDHYLRMMDILGELDERREPLLREKEKAVRYLDLSKSAKELDLFYAKEDYLGYEKEEEELNRSLRRSGYDLEKLQQEKSTLQEEREILEVKRNEWEKQFELFQELLREKTKVRDENYVELRIKEERHRQLQREMEHLRSEESYFEKEENLLLKIEEVKIKEELTKNRLRELNEEIHRLGSLQSLHSKGAQEVQSKKEKVTSELQETRLELNHIDKRRAELQELIKDQEKEKAELFKNFYELEDTKSRLFQNRSALERQLLRQRRENFQLEEDKKLFQEKESFLKTRRAELLSEISALDKNIALYEKWEEEGEKNLEQARKLLGGDILYKKIRPQKGYEKALEAALAQGINSLDLRGVPFSHWAKKVENHPVNLIYDDFAQQKHQDKKSLGSLDGFVKDPELGTGLLAGILVYENLEEALEGPGDSLRVTLKGERLDKGFYYGVQSSASPFEISLKLDEDREEKQEKENSLKQLEKEIRDNENLGFEIKGLEQKLAQEKTLLIKEEKSMKEKENILHSEERLNSFKKERSEESLNTQRIQWQKLNKRWEQLTNRLEVLAQEEKDLLSLETSSDLKNLDQLREKHLSLRLEEARVLEETKRWEEDLKNLELRKDEKEKRQRDKEYKEREYAKENRLLLEDLDSLREIYSQEQREIKKLDGQAFIVKKEIDTLRIKLPELEEKREVLDEEIYKLRDIQSKKEIRLSRFEERKNALSQEVWRLYEMSMLQIKDLELYCDVPRSHRKKIRQEMLELEPVNLKAPEEFDEVDQRHSFLKEQLEDIAASKKDLESTIYSLERRMKEEFSSTFVAIRENFKEIFSHLFRGGQGDILLEDPDDVLGSDILILASPPGKKLQHMNLLSGGEKALTAIALLFAVLKTKPAPFYVLDEIEAALDDINIQRFGTFLEEFSEGSQFILITHRKGTMEFADALYGVSMEEKGISSLVSLKMEES
ncbi:MAG: chromosome segregation protein SMC [Tissierellia bacterium]|nr:chromosome segregation protein SMC [Tissierellia bacterium]